MSAALQATVYTILQYNYVTGMPFTVSVNRSHRSPQLRSTLLSHTITVSYVCLYRFLHGGLSSILPVLTFSDEVLCCILDIIHEPFSDQ